VPSLRRVFACERDMLYLFEQPRIAPLLRCVSIGKGTKVLALLHIGYFGLFLIASVLGSFDVLGENIGVLGFVGIGF
jgi:hypothetical protein